MAIGLIDRIRTLLAADAHAMVESLEDRALMLKQCVREAELELNRKRARQEALADEEKRLREELARRREQLRKLDEDVQLALDGGKPELARFAIRRLIPRRDEVAGLAATIEQRAAEQRALDERIGVQAEQLEELKSRVRTQLIARAERTEDGTQWFSEPPVPDEEVELELMRRSGRGEAS
jgi:phage shock protein A